jgi:hypothetical protein
MRIYITSSVETAQKFVEESQEDVAVAVVEAEYGGHEVVGSSDALTLNHHVRPGRRCPCLYDTEDFGDTPDVCLISHFDLDTLGGVMALRGDKPWDDAFWALAAFVDVEGPHKVEFALDYRRQDHERLAAFWSWSRDHRLFAPRDGSIEDVTEFFIYAGRELGAILRGERDDDGRDFLEAEKELRSTSFLADSHGGPVTVLRQSDVFVNHLYYDEVGRPADVVVAHNTSHHSVTVSCSDGQVDCRALVQRLWGEKAGGHAGIAGSPRDREMTLDDAIELFEVIK